MVREVALDLGILTKLAVTVYPNLASVECMVNTTTNI